MKILEAITSLFFVTLTIQGWAETSYRPVEDYWRSTQMTFEVSDIYFNSIKCLEIAPDFTYSCIQGFNEAGRLASPRQQLLSKTTIDQSPESYRTVQDYGPLALVEIIKPLEISSFKRFIEVRDQQNLLLRDVSQSLFANHNNSPLAKIDFQKLIRQLRATTDTQTPDAMIVGLAINGQITATDAHGYLMPAATFTESTSGVALNRVGIGVIMQQADRGYSIAEIVPGGAAEAFGLKARDVILSIDGAKIDYTLSLDQVIKKMLGEEGSSVKLLVERDGIPQPIEVRRKAYQLDFVTGRLIDRQGVKTGYIKLISFSHYEACQEIKSFIKKFQIEGASSFILDLRNNGGGFVDQATCIAGLFLGPNQIAYRTRNLGATDLDVAPEITREELVTNAPLAVLVNEASASASELLAGALQDHTRAWIVGERTFGKATIQFVESFEYSPFGANYAHTSKIFYQPSGRTNQLVGIIPNFVVPFKSDASLEDRWAPREVDVFPGAIHAPTKEWVENRPEKVNSINLCRSGLTQTQTPVDFQLSEALRILDCDAN